MKGSDSFGAELLEYVKATDSCLHEAEFFEMHGIDYKEFIAANIENEEFNKFLSRAQHTIGRRVLSHMMKGKSTPALERYLRFRMYDYNAFVEECIRQEWKDRQAAQMAKADESIDRLANFMHTL